jgi:hypothetical protein
MERFLARYEGIHVLSLAVDDAEAARVRLAGLGFPVELLRSARATPEGEARFARIPLPGDAPRVQLIQHLTPELVWRADDLVHPNGAAALDAVVVVADPPDALAAYLSGVAGVPAMPDPAGGALLALGRSLIRVLPPEALGSVFPGVEVPSLPFVAGVVVRTGDGNAAASRLGFEATGRGLLARAAGVAVLFVG